MSDNTDYGKFILTFDPENPQAHFKELGLTELTLSPEALLPDAIPWPAKSTPTGIPLASPFPETDDLSKFKGYDALVVTWTSAEAASLASLFTPGHPVSTWYEYRHNVNDYITLVTGVNAPFNDPATDMRRYYHSMGLYFPCKIGNLKVLLFKSGLHLDFDGPAIPVKKLIAEIVQAVQPKVFITTGTGGAIGADVLLGDVIIATSVKFDCTRQFKNEPWKNAAFQTTILPAGVLEAITPDLTKVNAARVSGARSIPKMWTDSQSLIITTDFFAFDDSKDTYQLQGLGRVCDMGDAMVISTLQQFRNIQFFAVRNASDPQIPNPDNDIEKAAIESINIYNKYGALTTAASVVATWAIIETILNNPKK
jgi:nucleoside phosphorylase